MEIIPEFNYKAIAVLYRFSRDFHDFRTIRFETNRSHDVIQLTAQFGDGKNEIRTWIRTKDIILPETAHYHWELALMKLHELAVQCPDIIKVNDGQASYR